MDFDQRAVIAHDRVHELAGAVPQIPLDELLGRAGRRRRRRRIVHISLAVALVSVALAIVALPRTNETPPASLSAELRHVVQPSVGFEVDIPAAWQNTTGTAACTRGAWLYCAVRNDLRQGLVAFHIPLVPPATVEQLIDFRVAFLKSNGAVIKAANKTRIDGHDAAEIHYVLARADGSRVVEDVEYDIIPDNDTPGSQVRLVVGLIIVQDNPMLDRSLPSTVKKTIHLTLP